ncbi:MAG: PAS domain S-box protein [Gemmatimonadota bacterium]
MLDEPRRSVERARPPTGPGPDAEGGEHFRAVLENAPIGMALVGLDGRWLMVNRALCRIVGYPEEELLGLTFQDLTHPDDVDADRESARSLVAGEIPSYEKEKRYLRRDGSVVWALLSVSLLRGRGGEPQCFVSQIQDITARKQAEEALRYSEAKFAGIVSLSSDAIVSVDDEQRITLFNQGAQRIYGYAPEEVLEQPLDVLIPERFRGPHSGHLEAFGASGVPARSMAERGTTRVVGRRKDGSEFVAEASISQLTLGGRRIYTAVVRDVTDRERREERERLLAAAGRVLAASLEFEESLRSVVDFAVPALADWCVLDLLGPDDRPRAVRSAAADPARAEALAEACRRGAVDGASLAGTAVVEPTPSGARLAGRLPEDAPAPDDAGLARLLDPRSAVTVPLVAHGRTFGALTLALSGEGRRYGPEELALAEELGRVAALAIDNARLYRVAREARHAAERAADRTARLQRVTAALAGALTPAEVAEVVVREGSEALGAAAGTLCLLDEDAARLEVVRSVGLPAELVEAWRHFPLHAHVPLAEAVRTGEPVLVTTRDELAARFPALTSVLRHNAWAAVPLLADGRALGVIGLSFAEPRRFSEEEREFLLAIGRQCAGTLERARLYERERRARAEAEAASRARDEILGVVAHDLRNPLTAISMYASLLLEMPRDADTQRAQLRTVLELTEQMNRLIQDLLDASRIEAGQLRVHPAAVPVPPLLADAAELVRMAALERGVSLEVQAAPGLPPVLADRDRVLQVLSNLLGNAVKFTPRGGWIVVRAAHVEGAVEVSVADTGVGIPPEHLTHVFDRFWQGDARRKGAGLGLAIARGIVEAHGGRIRAESAPGQGSTFTFTLPAA